MSDQTTLTAPDADDEYVPRTIALDDLDIDFDEAVEASMVSVEDGQLVEGTVVKVDKDEVLLDIGYKTEGVIPSRELSIRNDVDPAEIVTLGDQIEALVLTKEDKDGRLVLSKKRAQYERAWGDIEATKEADGVVTGPVIEVVKGGLIIDIGLRGFLPASLVELRRVRDLQPYVGKELTAKIIELDKNRNNVVLSRRAWLEETQKEQREEFLDNLKPGEVRQGVVSSVVNFGAFVDLGGMDGLIHVSELSWKHVDHPGSVVAVGDEVSVQVLDVDRDRERISLSLKATQQDPWQEFASSHRVGELVYGRVTKLVPFGAFVRVEDGIEGLVHISELAERHVELPEQVVTVGSDIFVKVIDIDLERRRISLSLKQANEAVAAEFVLGSDDERVAGAVKLDDVERLAGPADAQAFALTDGVGGQPLVLAQDAAADVDHRAGAHGVRRPVVQEAPVVVIRHEAEVHRVMLAGDGQTALGGDAADLRFGIVADGKEDAAQFVLAQHAEHVALVFAFVDGFEQEDFAVCVAAQAGIVAGRQVVCAKPPRVVEQIVEADVAVAGEAGIGR